MTQNTYLFVEKITPEIIVNAQQGGISCVHEGIPPHYQAQAESEGWELPHILAVKIEEPVNEENVL